jgi:hypothetical protein
MTLTSRLHEALRTFSPPSSSLPGAPVTSVQPQALARALPRPAADAFVPQAPAPRVAAGENAFETQQTQGFAKLGFGKFPGLENLLPMLKAMGAMDTLLRGERISGSSAGNAEVTRDAADVNTVSDQRPDSARYQEANAQLQANAQLEEQRLANLPPEHRDTYLRVKQQLMAIVPAGDPVAALSLQKLLFTGKLTEGPSLKDDRNVSQGLAHLLNAPLAEGIDRQQLLADLVQELATPSAINQGPVGTCAATSVCIHMVRSNPAEYVRLVTGLASPEGAVATASGKMLRREPDAITDTTGRSEVQKLIAPAFMEIANPRQDYRNGPPEGQYRGDKFKGSGLDAKEVDRILEAVYDDRFKKHHVDGFLQMRPSKAMERIEEQLAQGEDVLAGLDWDGGRHKVLVTGTETVDGQRYVNYINPWGREERMTRDEFMDRLNNFNYEK